MLSFGLDFSAFEEPLWHFGDIQGAMAAGGRTREGPEADLSDFPMILGTHYLTKVGIICFFPNCSLYFLWFLGFILFQNG